MKRLLTLALVALLGPAAFAFTSADAANLLFLKQEEKLARDVYQALNAKWHHPTFANIARSEQQHMSAVSNLLVRYRVPDTTPTAPGVFTIPALQALYDRLVAEGSLSLQDALEVGVLVEETDIDDIQGMLDTTTDAPIRRVLTNLQNGSYNHLAAFNRALQ